MKSVVKLVYVLAFLQQEEGFWKSEDRLTLIF